MGGTFLKKKSNDGTMAEYLYALIIFTRVLYSAV